MECREYAQVGMESSSSETGTDPSYSPYEV